MKMFKSPGNEFRFHKCRKNRNIQKCEKKISELKKFTSGANEFRMFPN